jgi:hypothetical protein
VKSADTADLKSADPKRSWGFKSPSGHQNPQFALLPGVEIYDLEVLVALV